MKKLLLMTALVLFSGPAFAKEYVIREVSDPAGAKPYYFSPDKLTIQPGDTVTFMNAQEDMHEVMFINVPKDVSEMIASPVHRKQGDKFSYTFAVPGTYGFHCRAHEALGMKGTLIVGRASKSGETKTMDPHEKADDRADVSDLPQGTAKINAVDAEGHTINVTHDPIKALGWPKMKMEFSVDKGVDLSGFKAGDAVSFTLKPMGNDDYTVIQLKKGR